MASLTSFSTFADSRTGEGSLFTCKYASAGKIKTETAKWSGSFMGVLPKSSRGILPRLGLATLRHMRFGEQDDRDTVAFHARWKFSTKKIPAKLPRGHLCY